MNSPIRVRYVTIACGESETVYAQASMLLLSLMVYAPEPRELVVVTDHPERFAWFEWDARIHAVTREQLSVWRGKAPFSMRQKLAIACAMAPAKGALALFDPDTLVKRDLTPMVAALANGALFLHSRRFQLGYGRRRRNLTLWKEISQQTAAALQFRPGDAMWKSGVIALPAADLPLLRQAVQLCDAISEAGIRNRATDQLVLGQLLGSSGRLREALPWLVHYQSNHQAFNVEIAKRLSEARSMNLHPADAADLLRRRPIDLPAETAPVAFARVRRWLGAKKPVVNDQLSVINH